MQSVKRQIEVTMRTMITLLNNFHNDEGGQGLTEYLLVVALIALATIVGMNNAATKITSAFNTLGNKLANYIGT
jgi:Flp pilus assembly pilin Flp